MLDRPETEVPVIAAGHDFETVTESVAQIPLASRTPLPWVAIFLTALGLFGVLHMALGYLVMTGVGIFGTN